MSGVRTSGGRSAGACDGCLRRAWLLSRLSGHLEAVRARVLELLELEDEELIYAVGGRHRSAVLREWTVWTSTDARHEAERRDVQLLCGCEVGYPRPLRDLSAPPAVLHLRGDSRSLAAGTALAVVGTRRASPYGMEVAAGLSRGFAQAGLVVVSGMALGIDSAALAAAAPVGGAVVAVLPGGVDRADPPAGRTLHRQLAGSRGGLLISELPVGTAPRRWSFPARNRIIAALGAMTLVVEAGRRSGALLTARLARELGRDVGAVPGRITTPSAAGCHALLSSGATLVDGVEAVLGRLGGLQAARQPAGESRKRLVPGPALRHEERALLEALAATDDVHRAIEVTGLDTAPALAALAQLELEGLVRRSAGGAYTVSTSRSMGAASPYPRLV